MIHVPAREATRDEVARRQRREPALALLVREGDVDHRGGDRVELDVRVPRGRVEEDLQLRLEELPHPVRALAWRDLVPEAAANHRQAHRELPTQRLELALEVEVRDLRGPPPEGCPRLLPR